MNELKLLSEVVHRSNNINYEYSTEDDYFCIYAVCAINNVTFSQIKSKTRKQKVVWSRFICYDYLKKNTALSLQSIGDLFDRGHDTVIHGIKKYNNYIDINDKSFIEMVEKFNKKMQDY